MSTCGAMDRIVVTENPGKSPDDRGGHHTAVDYELGSPAVEKPKPNVLLLRRLRLFLQPHQPPVGDLDVVVVFAWVYS